MGLVLQIRHRDLADRPTRALNGRTCGIHASEPDSFPAVSGSAWMFTMARKGPPVLAIGVHNEKPPERGHGGHGLIILLISRSCRSYSRISAMTSRTSRRAARTPRLLALAAALAFPASVTGPVLCSHGRHCRIISACRARRSSVQPFDMLMGDPL